MLIADDRILRGYLVSMMLLSLSVADVDLVDADVELVDGSRVRVRFDVSPKDDGSSASWEPDVFHDEPMTDSRSSREGDRDGRLFGGTVASRPGTVDRPTAHVPFDRRGAYAAGMPTSRSTHRRR